jgi:hypothetical protein
MTVGSAGGRGNFTYAIYGYYWYSMFFAFVHVSSAMHLLVPYVCIFARKIPAINIC